jgi:glycosyltransferase involved in cell wall biosynthesis
MAEPSISVIVPCYNGARYLGEAIESVLAQTHPPLEIIVVDDGSSDGSPEVAKSYPVRLIALEKNAGAANARNIGIRAATGDLIATLDSDDVWLPHHCETVAALLIDHPSAAVGCSGVELFGNSAGQLIPGFPPGAALPVLRALLGKCPIPHSTTMFRRERLLEMGGYATPDRALRVGFSEDYDLFLRLAQNHPFVCSHDVTVKYRLHAGQISSGIERIVASAIFARLDLMERFASAGETILAEAVAESARRQWQESIIDARRARSTRGLRTLAPLAQLVPGLGWWERFSARLSLAAIPLLALGDPLRQRVSRSIQAPDHV